MMLLKKTSEAHTNQFCNLYIYRINSFLQYERMFAVAWWNCPFEPSNSKWWQSLILAWTGRDFHLWPWVFWGVGDVYMANNIKKVVWIGAASRSNAKILFSLKMFWKDWKVSEEATEQEWMRMFSVATFIYANAQDISSIAGVFSLHLRSTNKQQIQRSQLY